MRYENHTTTAIELVQGDIRDAPENYIVIGRNPALKAHFEQRTKASFKALTSWLSEYPVELSRTFDSSFMVLRTSLRPSSSSRQRQKQVAKLHQAIELPLVRTFRHAQRIAMVPLSCRNPAVVATAMVRMMWDISVAAFLNADQMLVAAKPTLFTIYCDRDPQPFIEVLDSGHYASLKHGTLFSMEVQCNPVKRARYLKRRRFKFRRVSDV